LDLDKVVEEKYSGEKAEKYDEKRRGKERWNKEQSAVEHYLKEIASLMENPSVLDIPVGTGRFFPLYEKFDTGKVVGVDASEDMLEQAKEKTEGVEKEDIELKAGDITDKTTYGIEPDIVVCVRLFNFLDENKMKRSLENLLNSGAEHIILGTKVFPNLMMYKSAIFIQKSVLGLYNVFNKEEEASHKVKRTYHCRNFIEKKLNENGFEIRDETLLKKKWGTRSYIYWFSKKSGR